MALADPKTPARALTELFQQRHVQSILVLQGDRLVGIVTPTDITRITPDTFAHLRARQIMSRALIYAHPSDSLYSAWLCMSRRGLRQLPVVERANPSLLLGIVTTEAIGKLLRPPTRSARQTPRDGAAEPVARDGEHDQRRIAALPLARGMEAGQPNERRPLRKEVDGDPLARLRVRDAMLTTPRLVRETDPVEVARSLLGVRGAALMVVDAAEQLVGIVMRGDLRGREDSEGERGLLVGDVAVRNLVTAAPDETLRVAVRRMNRISVRQLPVVESALPAPPAGLRRRQDVLSPNERSLGESTSSAEAQRQQAVERTMAAEDGARAASDAE